MAQFALTGFVGVGLLGFGAVQLLAHAGRSQAISDARVEARLVGEGIVLPAITPGLLEGRPRDIARMDRVVRTRVLQGSVVRVKLWDRSGRILYSDQHQLIGTRYPLGGDELHALDTGGSDAEISDLTRPENRFERGFKKLLEVYQGVVGPRGQRLLFESYLRYSAIAASGERQWLSLAPALIGTLVLLELTQIPLALSLARRVRRGQAERETLLQRAVEASEIERRRVARDLHDGVVQNMAGLSFSLSAAADLVESGRSEEGVSTVRDSARESRRVIRELRTLLVDIYPPNLQREGLAAAVSDLVASYEWHDTKTSLDIEPGLVVSAQTAPVLYRVAQEALRNVVAHAEAHNVAVSLRLLGDEVTLTVSDDGRGLPAAHATNGEHRRHFGLRILHDLVHDVGGKLTVESAPGQGTTLRAAVPV